MPVCLCVYIHMACINLKMLIIGQLARFTFICCCCCWCCCGDNGAKNKNKNKHKNIYEIYANADSETLKAVYQLSSHNNNNNASQFIHKNAKNICKMAPHKLWQANLKARASLRMHHAHKRQKGKKQQQKQTEYHK